jgi:large subunit ribosomal protein L10Ae
VIVIYLSVKFTGHTLLCSKLSTEALKEAITQVVTDAKEKNRKFTETIELQIGLKNYDPQKDKRFSGSVKLPHVPRPKMRVCMLGDAQHVGEVRNCLVLLLVCPFFCDIDGDVNVIALCHEKSL